MPVAVWHKSAGQLPGQACQGVLDSRWLPRGWEHRGIRLPRIVWVPGSGHEKDPLWRASLGTCGVGNWGSVADSRWDPESDRPGL